MLRYFCRVRLSVGRILCLACELLAVVFSLCPQPVRRGGDEPLAVRHELLDGLNSIQYDTVGSIQPGNL